jgi:hypothetical protein
MFGQEPAPIERVRRAKLEPEFLREVQRITERDRQMAIRLDIGDFGVWHLTVKEAADLVARDMWFSGDLEGIDVPEDCEDEFDSRLTAALSGVIADWEQRLLAAVESGTLTPSAVRRDLKDDSLVAGNTYIDSRDLIKWLRERRYLAGQVVGRWMETQDDIAEIMASEAISLREVTKTSRRAILHIAGQRRLSWDGKLNESDSAEVLAAWKAAEVEIHRLKVELAKSQSGESAKVDTVLRPRERRTLLVIIAAVCKRAGIDYSVRGAARRIRELTEEIGAPVDDGTILRQLEDISDALESRRPG